MPGDALLIPLAAASSKPEMALNHTDARLAHVIGGRNTPPPLFPFFPSPSPISVAYVTVSLLRLTALERKGTF